MLFWFVRHTRYSDVAEPMETQMDTKNIAVDFCRHIAQINADSEAEFTRVCANAKRVIRAAEQEMHEGKRLMEGARARVPESFDIVGRLNALSAERVVQVGQSTYRGLQMLVIDGQGHGTLLNFSANHSGVWGFTRLCWCCGERKWVVEAIETGIACALRSWDPSQNKMAEELMRGLRDLQEGVAPQEFPSWFGRKEGDEEVLRCLVPALKIEIKVSTPLRLASLTPKQWWTDCSTSNLRVED